MTFNKPLLFFLATALCASPALTGCSSDDPKENIIPDPEPEPEPEPEPVEMEWVLAFEDNFDGPELNTAVWSRIPQGNPDWANTQAPNDEECFEFRDGALVLKGREFNPEGKTDKERYHTGGIWSQGKKAFAPGKFEIRARMKNCRGAWPAIWLMPYDSAPGWPDCGEIDIMETLNFDKVTYQTVHSRYVDTEGKKQTPKHSGTYPFNYNDWNVFGVEMYEDRLVFTLNDKATLTYPRLNPKVDGQFPFYKPQELRIDQQLGGAWVGDVNLNGIIPELEVDWVKHYTLQPKQTEE